MRILVVRLGAMGDVIHTLPAVATLKRSFPESRISWSIEPRWSVLLESNPYIDRLIATDRRKLRRTYQALRAERFDLAIDFQGLLKSAAVVFFSGAPKALGFEDTRERAASVFYTRRVETRAAHVVDRNLELAAACGAGDTALEFPLPPGSPEGDLPQMPFVLACPLAGWRSKQWPLEHYAALALRLDMPVVLNGPPWAEAELRAVPGCSVQVSGMPGLIDATRRASAVIGVDSGPLHLAAALGKPGVAIFGPTDPARNGPYRSSIRVIRSPYADTTYRRKENDASVRAVSPEMVLEALLHFDLRTPSTPCPPERLA